MELSTDHVALAVTSVGVPAHGDAPHDTEALHFKVESVGASHAIAMDGTGVLSGPVDGAPPQRAAAIAPRKTTTNRRNFGISRSTYAIGQRFAQKAIASPSAIDHRPLEVRITQPNHTNIVAIRLRR
jgi:hypothetical protein